MLPKNALGWEYFSELVAQDRAIMEAVAAYGCVHCGGPLHQSHYARKPRGGWLAEAGEAYCVRFSLCCGRRGCRRRTLPPSLRFMGRKVYLQAVVVMSCVVAAVKRWGQLQVATGVAARTVRRWQSWWQTAYARGRVWKTLQARFAPPPPATEQLPSSLLERLGGASAASALHQLAWLLVLSECNFVAGSASLMRFTQKMAADQASEETIG